MRERGKDRDEHEEATAEEKVEGGRVAERAVEAASRFPNLWLREHLSSAFSRSYHLCGRLS